MPKAGTNTVITYKTWKYFFLFLCIACENPALKQQSLAPVFGTIWSMSPAVISIHITWKVYTFSVSAALGFARLEILNSKKQGFMLT